MIVSGERRRSLDLGHRRQEQGEARVLGGVRVDADAAFEVASPGRAERGLLFAAALDDVEGRDEQQHREGRGVVGTIVEVMVLRS